MKLYRGSDVLGIVTDPAQEGPDTIAKLELSGAAANYKDLLNYMRSVTSDSPDPPLALNIFEDWFIEDEKGVKRGIFLPAIRPDAKYISWRWKRN